MPPSNKRSPIVLGLSSIVATPVLWFVQFVAMWLDSIVAAVLVLLIGASTFIMPGLAFMKGRTAGASLPQVIGGFMSAIALIFQVWVILSLTGRCGLMDGC